MTYQELWKSLAPRYDDGEAKAIARTVLEVRFGMNLTDIICGKVNELSANNRQSLEKMFERLRKGEPVQYVLGEAFFCGHVFHVAPGVLIPRPETAELVAAVAQWVAERRAGQQPNTPAPSLLDIGTGSGCIAVSLALKCPEVVVSAWDISQEALAIAEGNAGRLGASVSFGRQDALCPPRDKARWDAIVSNPPYITLREKAEMEPNVLNYEPHCALFVPDSDPLRFYQSIAEYAREALREGGLLAFEINPLFANEMEALLRDSAFRDVRIVEDQYGKRRFAFATHI